MAAPTCNFQPKHPWKRRSKGLFPAPSIPACPGASPAPPGCLQSLFPGAGRSQGRRPGPVWALGDARAALAQPHTERGVPPSPDSIPGAAPGVIPGLSRPAGHSLGRAGRLAQGAGHCGRVRGSGAAAAGRGRAGRGGGGKHGTGTESRKMPLKCHQNATAAAPDLSFAITFAVATSLPGSPLAGVAEVAPAGEGG